MNNFDASNKKTEKKKMNIHSIKKATSTNLCAKTQCCTIEGIIRVLSAYYEIGGKKDATV